jgi:hypothetical protein
MNLYSGTLGWRPAAVLLNSRYEGIRYHSIIRLG